MMMDQANDKLFADASETYRQIRIGLDAIRDIGKLARGLQPLAYESISEAFFALCDASDSLDCSFNDEVVNLLLRKTDGIKAIPHNAAQLCYAQCAFVLFEIVRFRVVGAAAKQSTGDLGKTALEKWIRCELPKHRIYLPIPNDSELNEFTARLRREFFDATDEIASQGTSPVGNRDGKRPAYERDHLWLEWKKNLGPAGIRDKWNAYSDDERRDIAPFSWQKIKDGKEGREVVKKALSKASDEKK